MDNNVLQFELWNECNNCCKFCFNRYVYEFDDNIKLKSLQNALDILKNSSIFKKYNKIAFIGGEFFQGQLKSQKVKSKFFEIITYINNLLNSCTIDEFWITATLTFKCQDDLFAMLNLIDKKQSVWICTSYDSVGRFTAESLQNWKSNMLEIKKFDSRIKINVTSIISGQFADDYLSQKFSLSEFKKTYKCSWYSKTPLLPDSCNMTKQQFNNRIIGNFFPKRTDFLKFLAVFKQQETDEEFDRLYSSKLRSNALVKTYEYDKIQILLRDKDNMTDRFGIVSVSDFATENYSSKTLHSDACKKCKHSQEYMLYVDSDKCFICDKEFIKKSL